MFTEPIDILHLRQSGNTNEFGWHEWEATIPEHESTVADGEAFTLFMHWVGTHAREKYEQQRAETE